MKKTKAKFVSRSTGKKFSAVKKEKRLPNPYRTAYKSTNKSKNS